MTETIEYRTMDKSAWGAGPWTDEPDKMQWADEATGFPCLIVRNNSGALCGYVGVPSGHPWHGKGYDDCEADGEYIDVHGGLTFSAGCGHGDEPSEGICHIPSAGEPDDVWWLGFDCNHGGDYAPVPYRGIDITAIFTGEPSYGSRHGTYRDVAYVQADCRKLAALAQKVASA